MLFSASFSAIFIITGAILYVTIVPLLLTGAIVFLGPLGIILVHMQWLLQTNALTNVIVKKIVINNMSSQVFKLALILNHVDYDANIRFKINNTSVKTTNEMTWLNTLFRRTYMLVEQIINALFSSLLSFIPILGPLLVNQFSCRKRGHSYMIHFYRWQQISDKDAKFFETQHMGQFMGFGMSAGLLELLPIISIVTMISNTVGAAKWSVQLVKKSKQN